MSVATDNTDQEYALRMQQWTDACEDTIVKTLPQTWSGGVMAMPEMIQKSLEAHVAEEAKAGFVYGENTAARSLMEHFYKKTLERSMNVSAYELRDDLFFQLEGLLAQVIAGCKPNPNGSISLLCLMSVERILPVARLIHLLTHPMGKIEDLELLWNFLDSAWCFGHPRGYNSATLQRVEAAITDRFTTLARGMTHGDGIAAGFTHYQLTGNFSQSYCGPPPSCSCDSPN